MQLEDGTYRFVASASIAKVEASAPGHKFRARGPGVEGKAEVQGTMVTAAEAQFPLAQLDAGDMLGNREMKKFLGLDARPLARGALLEPMRVSVDGSGNVSGTGRIRLGIDGKPEVASPIPVRVEGRLPKVRLVLGVTFSALGYSPPKLLFLKVKDELALEVELLAER